ncbi:MAG: hypothetical protein ACTSXF_01025, partial [Promethearchaeota archaeon]
MSEEFIEYLKEIYPPGIVDKILDKDNLEIIESEAYKEVVETDRGFNSSGNTLQSNINRYGRPCMICENEGYTMTHQEFPGWTGSLRDKRLIVIGGEISPTYSNGFHIAYNLYGNKETDGNINERLGQII